MSRNPDSADEIPNEDIWEAHGEAKREMLDFVAERTKLSMDLDTFTMILRRASLRDTSSSLIQRAEKPSTGKLQAVFTSRLIPGMSPGRW
jgi:hypothetical protein